MGRYKIESEIRGHLAEVSRLNEELKALDGTDNELAKALAASLSPGDHIHSEGTWGIVESAVAIDREPNCHAHVKITLGSPFWAFAAEESASVSHQHTIGISVSFVDGEQSDRLEKVTEERYLAAKAFVDMVIEKTGKL